MMRESHRILTSRNQRKYESYWSVALASGLFARSLLLGRLLHAIAIRAIARLAVGRSAEFVLETLVLDCPGITLDKMP